MSPKTPYLAAVPEGRRPRPEMGAGSGDACRGGGLSLRVARRGVPDIPPRLQLFRPRGPRRADTTRLPKGSAESGSLKPRNFFHPKPSGRLPTRPSSGSGAPVGPVRPSRPSADCRTAHSRPLAAEAPGTGWGRGGRGAQARGPRPASFARGPRHAPRARSTWPRAAKCAPDPRDPQPAGRAGPAERGRYAISVFRAPGAPAPPLRPKCAGWHLRIWRAKSRGRPHLSPPRFFGLTVRGRRGRAPRAYLLPPAGNHLGGTQMPALGKADPPARTSPRLGPEGTSRSPCGAPGRKLGSAGGETPGDKR